MTTLITNSQFKQFDANGVPLAAGKIYTYVVGTTTDKATYQDKEKVAAHENPIILDSFGETTIWIDGDTKFVVTDSDDVPIRTYPSFSDSGSSDEPVISSPLGAVLRSAATETGYIKIRLPMPSWPNTRMMLDVLIYDESTAGSIRLNLSGFASSVDDKWEHTTSITNGSANLDIKYGNDGSYPAIYIGAVSTQWVKPQVSVVDFLAGQVSYDFATWDSDWEITVTTSLGTITSTDVAQMIGTAAHTNNGTDPGETPLNSDLGTSSIVDTGNGDANVPLGSDINGEWQDATLGTGWSIVGGETVQYRFINNKKSIQIRGTCERDVTGSSTQIFTLTLEYRPQFSTKKATFIGAAMDAVTISSTGTVGPTNGASIGDDVEFNITISIA